MAKTVMVVGGGAREHAIGKSLACTGANVLFLPGNAGTTAVGPSLPVPATDVSGIVDRARLERPDLVVVGPELPLTLGLSDSLRQEGIRCFGPSKQAARLEGSKAFMKQVLMRAAIPTAPFWIFDDPAEAESFVRRGGRPLVVKADGLAAGKGVAIPASVDECVEAIRRTMVDRAFGDAGTRIVLEEFLPGQEASFHVICDGAEAVLLPAAQDHKRLRAGDMGPNTGGMGAYAPAPGVTERVRGKVMDRIVEPTLRLLRSEGTAFSGVLFVGLMIERGEPSVLEYNVRFGDPEATVLFPLWKGDWFDLLRRAADGELGSSTILEASGAALSVVMASEGYPEAPRVGDAIVGLEESLPDTHVFHAGTQRVEGEVRTSGGRVLAVVGEGESLVQAKERAYARVATISYRGAHFRKDIGHLAGV